MDNPEVIIGLLIGAALGGVIGWLLGSRKGARAEAERAAAERRIEEHQKASEAQLAALKQANDEAIAQLKESFKALSADALKEAQPELVRLAGETLGKLHETAKGDLNTSKEAVAKLVAPLKEQLDTYQKRLAQSSSTQTEQLSKVSQQLESLGQQSQVLSKETEQLRQILNSSQQRGRWGEETLRRVVEASGLSAHCDFTEQAQAEQGRPDLVVHLPGDRHIVIDAKVPDLSFLNELETSESAQRMRWADSLVSSSLRNERSGTLASITMCRSPGKCTTRSGRPCSACACSVKSQCALSPEASTTRRSVSSPQRPRCWLEFRICRNCSVSFESTWLCWPSDSSCCETFESCSVCVLLL